MKRIFMTLFFGMSTVFAFAQQAETSLVSYTSEDKLAIARSSIEVPSWHEKSFWNLYENYVSISSEILQKNERLRKGIATLQNETSADDAALAAESFLKSEAELISAKRDYYQKMSDALNGIISLEFLQSEIVMDMMESATVYDKTPLKKFRFQPKLMSEKQQAEAKHAIINNALGLTKDNGFYFWNIYNKYEEEVDNILGSDYSLISFYAGKPSDFTPALAKRLGQDLLSVMEREQKLKEKYYGKLKDSMGPLVAAKFLAWEDYYSIVSKMQAWADSY